jgi:hypothetical protein
MLSEGFAHVTGKRVHTLEDFGDIVGGWLERGC